MNKILVIFSIFLSFESWANTCPDCKGKEKKPIGICFVDQSFEGTFFEMGIPADCGYWSEKFFVGNKDDMEAKLRELSEKCTTISRLTFSGHGSPGYHASGLRTGKVGFLRNYGCMLEEGINVRIDGCNVGRGCEGDMFLHDIAKNLFHGKQGSVNSPTHNSSTFLPGVIPSFSLNGVSRELRYNPSKKFSPEEWTQTGLAISDGGTMAEHCKNEITELIDDIKVYKKKCGDFASLSGYQSLAEGLSYSQSWDYAKVKDTIVRLKYHLNSLKDCKPVYRGHPLRRRRSVQ